MCILRSHSGDHINQALYIKEDLRVFDDVITLIFRIETRESVSWNSFFSLSLCGMEWFLEYIRYFRHCLVVKWHSLLYNYAFGNDTCSAMRVICVTGFKGIR